MATQSNIQNPLAEKESEQGQRPGLLGLLLVGVVSGVIANTLTRTANAGKE